MGDLVIQTCPRPHPAHPRRVQQLPDVRATDRKRCSERRIGQFTVSCVGLGAMPFSMSDKPEKPAEAAEALKFFSWAYAKGGAMADSLDYVSMPANVISDIQKMWQAEIKGADGKPLYSPTN